MYISKTLIYISFSKKNSIVFLFDGLYLALYKYEQDMALER